MTGGGCPPVDEYCLEVGDSVDFFPQSLLVGEEDVRRDLFTPPDCVDLCMGFATRTRVLVSETQLALALTSVEPPSSTP
jgi:hypothetical protein